MRNFILIIALLISSISYSQVGLKGFILGERIDSSRVHPKKNLEIFPIRMETSVGGRDGRLNIMTLKGNGIIYELAFCTNKVNLNNFTREDEFSYRKSIDNHFGIELKLSSEDYIYNDVRYGAEKNGIIFSYSSSMDTPEANNAEDRFQRFFLNIWIEDQKLIRKDKIIIRKDKIIISDDF